MSTQLNLKNLQNKKIAILGLGMENYALVKYLLRHKVKCEITICDARKNVGAIHELPLRNNIHWQLGKDSNRRLGGAGRNLEKFDILFRSPGWPTSPLPPLNLSLSKPACPACLSGRQVGRGEKKSGGRRGEPSERLRGGRAGGKVSSPIKLFFQLCPTKNIIGVTGTKGKGTTASLIYEILKKAGKRVWLGGNIGVAPFEFIDKIKKQDLVILELSSFQLEDMNVSPHIAAITNFYPEHLAAADPNNPNFHKSLADYWRAKANIIKYQSKGDWVILNSKFRRQKFSPKAPARKELVLAGGGQALAENSKIIYFKKSYLPSKLVGEHNKENIAAAVAVAKILGIKQDIIKKIVASFKGLEHRLEFVRTVGGVKYYNDSFATTPESAIIALNSFNNPIILIAGGAEKKSNFKKLAREAKKRVKYIILLKGAATPRMKQNLLNVGWPKGKMKITFDFSSAVRLARENSTPGDIVLLSPACASFGMFKNYKERGNLFKLEVKRLTPL